MIQIGVLEVLPLHIMEALRLFLLSKGWYVGITPLTPQFMCWSMNFTVNHAQQNNLYIYTYQ